MKIIYLYKIAFLFALLITSCRHRDASIVGHYHQEVEEMYRLNDIAWGMSRLSFHEHSPSDLKTDYEKLHKQVRALTSLFYMIEGIDLINLQEYEGAAEAIKKSLDIGPERFEAIALYFICMRYLENDVIISGMMEAFVHNKDNMNSYESKIVVVALNESEVIDKSNLSRFQKDFIEFLFYVEKKRSN